MLSRQAAQEDRRKVGLYHMVDFPLAKSISAELNERSEDRATSYEEREYAFYFLGKVWV